MERRKSMCIKTIPLRVEFSSSLEQANLFDRLFMAGELGMSKITLRTPIAQQFFSQEALVNFEFTRFAQAYFDNVDDIYTPTAIQRPLLMPTPKVFTDACVQAFQALMVLMGDIAADQLLHAVDLSLQIIKLAVERYEVRDDIFCQVCKQTNQNPSATSALRGWRFIALLLQYATPSELLAKFLMRHIMDRGPDQAIKDLCAKALIKAFESGPRLKCPDAKELLRFLDDTASLSVRITINDTIKHEINFGPSKTVADVVHDVMMAEQIPLYAGWSIAFQESKGALFIQHLINCSGIAVFEAHVGYTRSFKFVCGHDVRERVAAHVSTGQGNHGAR
jgi:hypothetical protein